MEDGEVKRAGRLAYRESLPPAEPAEGGTGLDPVLLLHGFPESSFMWRDALGVIADCGRRGIAPDLLGYGDSPPDPPATWERHVEALAEFVDALELDRVVLVVHDWGGLIGLRWACDHPGRIAGLLISDSGFFPDGRWHGLADVLRSDAGEELIEGLDRDGFAGMIRAAGRFSDEAIDEYWKAYSTPEGRAGALEMYRSGDFSELAPYEGRLAELGVPTQILWGSDDAFAPVAGAHRFRREIPHSDLEVIDGAGHFIWSDEPERSLECLRRFLRETAGA